MADNIARMGTVDQAAVIAAARRADVHEMIGRLPEGYRTEVGDGKVLTYGTASTPTVPPTQRGSRARSTIAPAAAFTSAP